MSNADTNTVIVVVGDDAEHTGTVALEVAEYEGGQRPVTVVDLIGDAPPLRAVTASDDPHGVADCFEYGLSFTAVSHPTTIGPTLSMIGSGTVPIPYDRALTSPRWDRLIDHVRESGGLIVFAVLSGTPGLRALVTRADRVLRPRAEPVMATVIDDARRVRSDTLPFRARPAERMARPVEPQRSFPRSLATGLVAAATVLLVVAGWWLTARPGAGRTATQPTGPNATHTDTTTSTAQLAPSAAETGTASAKSAAGRVVNPGDSSTADGFAVRVGAYPSYAEALRALRLHAGEWQATTIVPVAAAGTSVNQYLLITGAAKTRGGLDSAVARWTPAPQHGDDAVVHTPYALLLVTSLPADVARRRVARWIARGVPVYPLADDSGRQSIYAGAFDTVDEAAPLAASLHAAGLTAVPAYRTGRMP